MACNTPPTFANVDAAILARNQYIPFESSFSDNAPETLEAQFEATGRRL